ncbi:putative membrane protein [Campylobacter pinnipediorum subsp. pinnipediorum]|uniref:hypothetical protein n=2 Tax=Campylobacter pinnipediorum TaxID=1965231 RepID=UPI0009C1F428|nr:hypothetical protein [Campylobacter pinnipediorum]AQW81408.1 putative membrane protein [Campylobacter pinnipediorum subsp. pinnipediorum]
MRNEKLIRLFKVLYILSFILDLTIIGLLVGIPLFLVLWASQYVFFGILSPIYVFRAEKRIEKIFKKKSVIKTRIERTYDIQFGKLGLDENMRSLITNNMEKNFITLIPIVQNILDKKKIKFDFYETINPLIQLIDIESIILTCDTLILRYASTEEERKNINYTPLNESLIEIIDNSNKEMLSSYQLVEKRIDIAAKFILLLMESIEQSKVFLEDAIMTIISKEMENNDKKNIINETPKTIDEKMEDFENEIFNTIFDKDKEK